jgi:hypothetical protein
LRRPTLSSRRCDTIYELVVEMAAQGKRWQSEGARAKDLMGSEK